MVKFVKSVKSVNMPKRVSYCHDCFSWATEPRFNIAGNGANTSDLSLISGNIRS